jgi:restriction system protein
MELPKYNETFIPILQVLRDGKVIHTNELKRKVRDVYFANLSPELLDMKTTNGDNLLLNRIAWGKAYLKQGKMIYQPERAMVQITDKGRVVLEKGHLTLGELIKDSDFQAHRTLIKEEKESETHPVDENASPEEFIDSGIAAIEGQVKNELLEKLKEIDPYFFETVVLKLLKKMGYGEFQGTSKSGDGGIDGIINQDQLGLDKIYIQAKRYNENKVHETDIRNFIGAMSGDTSKGIFVTTSTFDDGAVRKAKDAHHKIILIDGSKLVDLMYKHSVGVQVRRVYEVKEVDEEFFEDN